MPPHYQDNNITIHKLKCGPYDNNAYLLVCPETNESIIVDTPADPSALIETAKLTIVKAILITHNHSDHIQGLDEVVSAIDVPIGIAPPDAHGLTRTADIPLNDGSEIKAGTITLRAMSTPGHTPGSTCLVVNRHLFTGDTLFPGGPGKTRSPENLRQIINSITEKLFALGDEHTFYPGHGDDGDLQSAKDEYEFFATRNYTQDLYGDVLWLKN